MGTDPLVTMLVGGLAAAFGLGFAARWLRIPLVAAYIGAGLLAGPYMFGKGAELELIRELADLGLVLMMFGLGMRFPPPSKGQFRWAALPGAVFQIGLVIALGYGVAALLGFEARDGIILGAVLPLSSAYVLLSAPKTQDQADAPAGLLVTSWLSVQAGAAILLLILVTTFVLKPADDAAFLNMFAEKAAVLGAFILAIMIFARRILAGILVFVARTRSREIFSLGVYATALCIAYAAYVLFGAGFALGAFLAGVALNQAELSRRAGDDLIPFRDAFAVLFFVTLGMMIDPRIVVQQGMAVTAIVALIMLGNGGAAFLAATILRQPLGERLVLAASLAMAGEFTLMIAGTAFGLDLISENLFSLIALGAAISISINPFTRPLVRRLAGRYA